MYGNAFCLKSLPLSAEIYSIGAIFKHDKVVFLFLLLLFCFYLFIWLFLFRPSYQETKIKVPFSINGPICVTNIAHVTNTDISFTFEG